MQVLIWLVVHGDEMCYYSININSSLGDKGG